MNVMKGPMIAPLVSTSITPEGLAEIHREDCAASIWSRDPSPAFRTWIEQLDPDLLPRARMILSADRVRDAMTLLCEQYGTPDCDERSQLIDDTAALATIFADVMDTPFVRCRLDVIENNACRKFHIDVLKARLICTYRGTGTQYGVGPRGSDPETIETVPSSCPIILRGTLWPNPVKPGLLHRSPPIEGLGETRLVLVLDPVENQENQSTSSQLH